MDNIGPVTIAPHSCGLHDNPCAGGAYLSICGSNAAKRTIRSYGSASHKQILSRSPLKAEGYSFEFETEKSNILGAIIVPPYSGEPLCRVLATKAYSFF